jgi:hypothetical protein
MPKHGKHRRCPMRTEGTPWLYLYRCVSKIAWPVRPQDAAKLSRRPFPLRCPSRTHSALWGGRPIRAKTYGKKREHGQNSCKIVPLSLDLVRVRHRLPVYCVQSVRASWNGRDVAAAVGVLHAANRGPNAGDDFACNTDPWAIACRRFLTGSAAHCRICPDPRHCVQDATVRFRAEGPSAPSRPLNPAAVARRACQGWPRLSRPPEGLGLDWPEHGGILDRIGATLEHRRPH